MEKKFISILTLVAFIIFSISCYTIKKERIAKEAPRKWEKARILAVMKTSGEHVEFPKGQPGRIRGYSIIGTVGYTQISIPLSEVELVWVKRVDPALTFIAVIGSVALALTGLLVIIALTKESCPFIYSFDGERYIFDAEPYGGAICLGLKRTEWSGLQYLKEVNGQYKIMITNEVNETQYTDELKLVAIDHAREVKVVPDVLGEIHTIFQPLIPIQAFDGKGRDLMPYICENDWIFWQTRTEEINPEKMEDLRDELIFEFPKPRGENKAKFIVNACTTLWGSQIIKRYLDLYGNKVNDWYDEVNNLGPAYYRMLNAHLREELYSLHIRVETNDGWKSKGLIMGAGPFVSEDRVYTLDISDVPGDTLKIKLTPPATFWMINYLAVDYSDDLPVQITEIEASEAIDYKGRDVREILAKNDDNYLIMPNIGDSAELIFASPHQMYGMDRSVILKASGYYDIHLKGEGEPKFEILEKIHSEPGYAVQYAFKEYLKWKKENMKKIEHK
jgi:hypothetical protein